jgi:hypothetical protein
MKEERKLTSRVKMRSKNIIEWSVNDVITWLVQSGHTDTVIIKSFKHHEIDGKALLTLREDDLKAMTSSTIGVIKRLNISIKQLQRDNVPLLLELGHIELFSTQNLFGPKGNDVSTFKKEMKNISHLSISYTVL